MRLVACCVAAAVIALSCGGGSDDEAGNDRVGIGELVISGSSTVEPIAIAVAEAYRDIDPELSISVSGPGTGDGFRAFCDGETDISNASRQIRDEEVLHCAENEIPYVELKVGIDGIAVLTGNGAGVDCLSFADLYAVVGPESTGFQNWSDGDAIAGELGSAGGLPESELVISAPGTESGTYDSFIEIVISDIAEARGQDAKVRPDYSSAADDNVIIETLSSNPTSFGWVGFAFAAEASDVTLVPISTEPGGPCVDPTAETIASNEYPISRDLYMYVNTFHAERDPAMAAFVDYFMTTGLDSAVAQVGYVPLADDAKAETRVAWDGVLG